MSIFRCLTVLARPLALFNFSLTITFHIYSLKVNNCCFSDGCVIWRCFSVFLLFVRNLKKIMIDEIHYFHHFPSFPIPHHISSLDGNVYALCIILQVFHFCLKMIDITSFCPVNVLCPSQKNRKWFRCSRKVTLKQETFTFYFLNTMLCGHRTVSQAKSFGLKI